MFKDVCFLEVLVVLIDFRIWFSHCLMFFSVSILVLGWVFFTFDFSGLGLGKVGWLCPE